ncbi:hypothetical protein G6F56_005110 [Rhizopus delemar]|nr:hypothetical protein G6F56_005110 [Rhizopus delemar]
MGTSYVPFDLTRDVPSTSRHSRFSILSKAPAICLSKSNFIKPHSQGEYMEADDPTDIANIRRSLIQQEFPYSDLNHISAAQLQDTNESRDISETEEEAHEGTHLLDESTHSPPTTAVADDTPDNRRLSYQATETNLINRFKKQHQKGVKRHLDHSKFTSPEDLPYLGDSDISLPLEILFRIALYINQAKAQKKIESSLVSVTTNSIDTLVNSLTAFERIVHTPIPKAYNIHLKQAVMLYIFFLPFALVDTLGWLVAPVVTLVSFTLFGIEAIGAEIENPFGYDDNDLPLNRYCDELKKEVEYIIYHIPTKSTNILLDALAQAPLNAGVAISNPILGNTVTAGSNYTISWTVLDENATTIESIGLWKGNSAYLTPVILNFLTNGSIPVQPPYYNWQVPANLTSESDYVLTMVGNNSYTTYSSYFAIRS